mmetsp:Transcript_33857/g.72158  ORF Transcript_33857/g.72158 Transcript_33857/m.72158 type:complete len:170 (-) Transcript_33857:74-583(-)
MAWCGATCCSSAAEKEATVAARPADPQAEESVPEASIQKAKESPPPVAEKGVSSASKETPFAALTAAAEATTPRKQLAKKPESDVISTWVYRPCNHKRMHIRAEPFVQGVKKGGTPQYIECEEVLSISEERAGDPARGEQNILFLKLADGRGWVFDHKPDVGVMCKRAG